MIENELRGLATSRLNLTMYECRFQKWQYSTPTLKKRVRVPLVLPKITPMQVNFTQQSTCLRKPISAEERVCKLG